MRNIGILGGLGEVGQAISKLYGDMAMIKDKTVDQFEGQIDLIHVCVPYKTREQFRGIVEPVIKTHEPKAVVIHSTVGIGTTASFLPDCYPVVHSPMRGVHPDLYGGLMTFVKYIGYDLENKDVADMVAIHFETNGVMTKKIKGSRNTEAGKLWSTSQYGFNIIIQKHIKEFCKKHSLNFDIVYREFNTTYNAGFADMKIDKYRKYVLDDVPGGIGGHCVVPNWGIMAEEQGDKMCAMMLDANLYFLAEAEGKTKEEEDNE